MVNETMINRLQKILERILERNGATNCLIECGGETMEISYSFWVSSGGDMSNDFEIVCENTLQETLCNVEQWFRNMYDEFDEDEFVREYMDMDGAPTVRTLLSDSEEVCNFYESIAITLSDFCSLYKNYRDTESGETFTKFELLDSYIENENDIYESSGAENFWQYLNCCLTGNGTLEEIE